MFFKKQDRNEVKGRGANGDGVGGYSAPRDSRRSVESDASAYAVEIDGVRLAVRDMSEGGFSVVTPSGASPEKGVATLYQNDRPIRRDYAMRCWLEGGLAGYKLIQAMGLVSQEQLKAENAEQSGSYRRRLAAARAMDPKARVAPPVVKTKAPVNSGAALRARLRNS